MDQVYTVVVTWLVQYPNSLY